jgi:hypothetical protein
LHSWSFICILRSVNQRENEFSMVFYL